MANKFKPRRNINAPTSMPEAPEWFNDGQTKIYNELGWRPNESFETGIRKTVSWYIHNEWWWRGVMDDGYKLKRQGGFV